MTIQRIISEIAINLNNQLIQKSHEFHFYSLAIDESTDFKDTAQLLIYIRGVDKSLEITEELAGLCSMHDHITGKNICEEIIKCLENKLK